MPLKPGWYRLRIVSTEHPDPGIGGMYLTLTPDGNVVVAALGPDTFEAQRVCQLINDKVQDIGIDIVTQYSGMSYPSTRKRTSTKLRNTK